MNTLKNSAINIINYIKQYSVEVSGSIYSQENEAVRDVFDIFGISTPCSLEEFKKQLDDLNDMLSNMLAVPIKDGVRIKYGGSPAYISYVARIIDYDCYFIHDMHTIENMIKDGTIIIEHTNRT